MKFILTFIFGLFSLLSISQIKVDKKWYEGDSVFVYPVVLANNYRTKEIPLLYDSLPSGKYILESYSWGKVLVVAKFVVSNGKVNGMVSIGESHYEYKDGLPHGEYFGYNYLGMRRTGSYKNGLKHGLFKEYRRKGPGFNEFYLFSIQEYKKGSQEGIYKLFYPNGQLRFYCSNYNEGHNDLNGISNIVLNKSIEIGYYNRKTNSYLDEFPSNGKKKMKEYIEKSNLRFGNKSITNKVFGDFEGYFPNGKILVKGRIIESDNKGFSEIDFNDITHVFKNGNPTFKLDTTRVDSMFYITLSDMHRDGSVYREYTWTTNESGVLTWYSKKKNYINQVKFRNNQVYKSVLNYNVHNSHLRKKYEEVMPVAIGENENGIDTLSFYFKRLDQQFKKTIYQSENKTSSFHVLDLNDTSVQIKRVLKDTVSDVSISIIYTIDVLHNLESNALPYQFSKNFFDWKYGGGNNYNLRDFCISYAPPNYDFQEDSIYVEVSGKPFSGKFEFKSYGKYEQASTIELKNGNIAFYNGQKKKYSKCNEYMEFVNGVPHGVYTNEFDTLKYENGMLTQINTFTKYKRIFKKDKKLLKGEKFFKNHLLEGRYVEYKWKTIRNYKNYKGLKRIFKGYENHRVTKRLYGLKLVKFYNKGKLEGERKYWNASDYSSVYEDSLFNLRKERFMLPFELTDSAGAIGLKNVSNFKNGKRHGKRRSFDEGVLADWEMYSNGKKHGFSLELASGDTMMFLKYVNDTAQGKFYLRSPDGGHEKHGFFKEGLPDDLWVFYSKYGVPNAKLRIDTAYIFASNSINLNPTDFDLNDIKRFNISGYIELFYSNGEPLAVGELTNGKRSGSWSFYNDLGHLIEQNVYSLDTFNIDTVDFSTNGNYTLLNSNGDTIAKGKLLAGVDLYDCSSDLKIRDYDRTHTLFLSDEGDTLVKNGKGHVRHTNEFGMLLNEGNVEQGVKNGEWRFYDPNGNLTELGSYHFGLRDGVWFTGDLRAIEYKNSDCENSNTDYSTNEELEEIDITRTNYRMDEVINSTTIKTYKRN